MNTRDQFGNYLLLKKLSEDALGEEGVAAAVGIADDLARRSMA